MNYPKMRRADRQLSQENAIDIIEKSDYAILSLSHDNMPYGVPLSPVISGNTIYFHCAHDGFKIDIIKDNPYGHFVFISSSENSGADATVFYESAMVHGSLRFVTSSDERKLAFSLIIDRYMSSYKQVGKKNVTQGGKRTTLIAMDINKMSAKANRKI